MDCNYSDFVISIAYSLPHVISASAGVIYAGYIGLLYINTYKWDPDDFGKICSFYFISTSVCQFIFSLMLQFVFVSADENIGLRNCKITQVLNITAHSRKFFINTVSLFLLILLPILKLKRDDRKASLGNSENSVSEDNNQNFGENSECSIISSILDSKFYILIIYLLFFIHAYGWGAYEICDRLLPTYITKDATYLSSTNFLIRAFFVFSIPVLIIALTKVLGKRYPDYVPYLGVSIFLLIILIPISVLFYVFTQRSYGSFKDMSNIVPASAKLDYPVLIALAIADSISPLLYLTCPAVIQYISTHLLDNDAEFRICASTLFLLFYFLGSVFYKGFNIIVKIPKKIIAYFSIACHSIGYILVFRHDYSWNKKGLLYYIIICVYNMFVMISFVNTSIIVANQLADDNHKKYRWLIQGFFYLFKNVIISILMRIIYKTYGREQRQNDAMEEKRPNGELEESRQLSIDPQKCGLFQFTLNFRNLFIILYFTCQIAGLICISIYKEHKFD